MKKFLKAIGIIFGIIFFLATLMTISTVVKVNSMETPETFVEDTVKFEGFEGIDKDMESYLEKEFEKSTNRRNKMDKFIAKNERYIDSLENELRK